jgi:hypothetical protein
MSNRVMYWTDRGDPPRGNMVNRAPMDSDGKVRSAPELVLTHLMEGIGIALDLKGDRMFVTDFGGNVLVAKLDGSDVKPVLVVQGNLTGIAYSEISCRGRRHRVIRRRYARLAVGAETDRRCMPVLRMGRRRCGCRRRHEALSASRLGLR